MFSIMHQIILRSKSNQTMKLGQLIEYTNRNYPENESEKLLPDLFLFFKYA